MASRPNGRPGAAVATVTAPVRCAVYTRKSTDQGLDRDFTSLDNQRERCEAYIADRTGQGMVTLSDRYDDGGFSGGTVDRPALQRLLADVKAGRIDCVVAYKYDRLGRSMIDCLKMFDFFEKRGVRFISVTQDIDTSKSHGRMFMNSLLSHAQFERDLIAERTRDKMRAARRRGKWTGGHPPLGYNVVDRKLVPNKDEAEQVEAIFGLYAETPSLVAVAQELNRRGWAKKSWTARDGKRCGGGTWDRVSLGRLLKDPLYVGQQKLGAETFPGEHRGIVPKALFQKVQRLMDTNRRTGGAPARNKHGFLLRGLLRCAACDAAMVPHPAKSHGRIYRYYTCRAAQKRGHGTCPTKSVKADTVEQFAVDQIRRIGADRALQDEVFNQAVVQVKAQRRGLKLEAKRIVDELTRSHGDVERLVGTVSRVDGPAADAVAAELTKAQTHVQTLEVRQAEVADELDALKAQDVDRDAVARALLEFDELWSVLLTPERERILRLLIERIDYDGGIGKLRISWRLGGFGELAAEVAP